MDVTKTLPHKIIVKDPHGKIFMQEIQYDWVPKFCESCLQAGHYCAKNKQHQTRKELKQRNQNPREKNQTKQWIWQTKQPHSQVIVQKHGIGEGIEPTQQHDPKDDEGWQEARRKSANKGNKNVSIATIRMPTNNGFDPL